MFKWLMASRLVVAIHRVARACGAFVALGWARWWIRWPACAAVLVVVLLAGNWTVRHAWAIYRLNRGVGGTIFLDASGKPWFPLDDARQDVPLDRIATFAKDAVIAVEDHRYYLHPGVDPVGLARAVIYNAGSDRGRQGGSTLTQQLARTLFLSNTPSYTRKLKEAALAVMLEAFLSKREILELYLNRVYMGGGYYGMEATSRAVFRKPAAELSLAQAAMLAGIIRAPATYSPWNHPDAARRRSWVVLARMREEHKITEAQERAARAERLTIQAPPAVASARHGYAKDLLRQQFRALHGGDNPPDWTVQTTFVPELQDAAEVAVRDGLKRLNIKGLEAALVAIDPATGNLLAVVGGSNYANTTFNRAVRSHRQPGSAFKPFVYAAALEHGLTPISVVTGLRGVAVEASDGVWMPRDQRAELPEALTLREALLESNNAAAVRLQQQIGAQPVLKMASDAGVPNQPDVPSLALGSGSVSPLDLTAAYSVFPNLGLRVKPRGIVAVNSAQGDEVYYVHTERTRVLPETTAFQMVTMLQDVIVRGTGARVRDWGVPGMLGGKTGTTNDYHDAWFVGFSPAVVAGVWVGFDQPAPIRDGASGARAALPIWADFMRRSARRLPSKPIAPPGGLQAVQMCSVSYHRAVSGCPGYTEYFKDGDDIPSALCPLHPGTFGQTAKRAIRGVLNALFGKLTGKKN
jgi:1A family penicillin-binding protein